MSKEIEWEEVDDEKFNRLHSGVSAENARLYKLKAGYKYIIVEECKHSVIEEIFKNHEDFILKMEERNRKEKEKLQKQKEIEEKRKLERKLKQLEKLKKELGE